MEDRLNDTEALNRWAEFNRLKWGCKPKIVKFRCPDSDAYIESLLFFNRYGKVYLPPLNPFHPTVFYPTPSDKPFRTNRQWHQAAETMVHELTRHGGSASFCFPPGITDIRPFLWRGFKANVKYTYHIKLPYSIEAASTEIRNKIKKADNEGYYSVLSTNMQDVYTCLLGTESRKGFRHNLTPEDLELARNLLGHERFRCYVCYSKEGEPVSASVLILLNEGWALGWVAGSKSEHISKGVVQQSQYFAFQDLSKMGVRGIDLVGANLPSVAKSKSNWGGELVPYYQVRLPIFKEILRSGMDWLKATKNHYIR